MPGHADLLPLSGTDLAADAVGVLDGDVQEVAFPGGAVMGYGALDQVAEIIQFVAVLDLHPAFRARPSVGVLRIPGAGGVDVTVGLLRRGHDDQHAVDVGFQLRVRIGLQEVGGAFDGFVHVRVVERKPAEDESEVLVGVHLEGRFLEVAVASRLFAFREGERDGHFPRGLQALAPERIGDLDGGKGNGAVGVVVLRRAGTGNQRGLQLDQAEGEGGTEIHMS